MPGHGRLFSTVGSLTPETTCPGMRVVVHYACSDDQTGTVLGLDGQWALLAFDGYEGNLKERVLISEMDPLNEPLRSLAVEAEFRNVFTGQDATYRGPILLVRVRDRPYEERHELVIDPMTTIVVRPQDYQVIEYS